VGLHSLRKLRIRDIDRAINSTALVAGLTQLHDLNVYTVDEGTLTDLLPSVSAMAGLKHLKLRGSDFGCSSPQLVHHVFTHAGAQLRSLSLGKVGQAGFEALLTYGTQLTRLTCSNLGLSRDLSQSACHLKELVVEYNHYMWTLACLPLHSLDKLSFGPGDLDLPSACPRLGFYLGPTTAPEHHTPAVLHKALQNLTRCPAWQRSGPSVALRLGGAASKPWTLAESASVIEELSILSSKQVSVQMGTCSIGAPQVHQLETALGSSLKHLKLRWCTIDPSFWPAVWRHLPELQRLEVCDERVQQQQQIAPGDVASFCSHATHPLQLILSKDLYQAVQGDQLEQLCRTWGVPQVTVGIKKLQMIPQQVPAWMQAMW
jgi:hypothetical protein